MRIVLLMVAISFSGSAIATDYRGKWRESCGDPARWSDAQLIGPAGSIVAIDSPFTVSLRISQERTIRFTLAGIVPRDASNPQQLVEILADHLIGKHVTSLLYKQDQEGTISGVLLTEANEDIGIQLILKGLALYKPSEFLTSYENCLYGAAQKAVQGNSTQE